MSNFGHINPAHRYISERDWSRLTTVAICTIVLVSSIPLMLSYIAYSGGHDAIFHLYRIDGIAQGIKAGQLPVLMQSAQIKGYGYPVSICYGDLFLYFPALLRVLGFSMHTAYSLFIVLINSICAVLTYHVSKRVFGRRSIGIMACALWTLSPYRLLIDTYLRVAVGELTALSFFPAVLYGLYSIIWYKSPGSSRNGWIWCAVGVTAVIYSHVLSIMLGLIVFLPILIFELIKKRDPVIVRNILLAAATTFLLSLAFIVPFLDYYSSVDMRVNTQDPLSKQALAQAHAVQPTQLFELFPKVEGWSVPGNTVNEMPYGIGWSLLSAFPLWGMVMGLNSLRCPNSKDITELSKLIAIQTVLLMWGATVFFPWDYSSGSLCQKLISILSTIQFPWRLVGPISFLLLVLQCIALSIVSRSWAKRAVAPIATSLIIFSLTEAGVGISSYLNSSQELTENYHEYEQTYGIMNGEYLPNNIDITELMERPSDLIVTSPGIEALSNGRNPASSYSIHVNNKATEGYAIFPLIFYPHYKATTSSGSELTITSSDNGLIQVSVPEHYSGDILVTFTAPLSWRVSEALSIFTAVGLTFYQIIRKKYRPSDIPVLL